MTTLRLILGDQLSHDIAALKGCDKDNDIILMVEVWDEATYVHHHKKKIAFLFSAMRHFAAELQDKGYSVHYTKLDDEKNTGSFRGEIERAIKAYKPDEIIVTFPGEYRVLQDMIKWESAFEIPVDIREDNRFLCTPEKFEQWAQGRKSLRMEFFYRDMRRDYNILMDGDKPEGGEWNYDSENRKPPKEGLLVPPTYTAQIDDITREVIDLVATRFGNHFGDLEPFYFAVTRDQALHALDKFITERLQKFGDYQDAMVEGEPWMFHAHISFYLNCGLLKPLECIQKAQDAYKKGKAPLNATEGFIRQIMGWREYIRGIYWMKMPDYAQENFLEAKRKLPNFFWGAPTHMNCLKQCIKETKENAYAHHIQRLMVLGNFALIAGIDPKYVNEWYLIVYADAYEWVELPNVSGMILYADGGYLASKPYAASGAYINKMSDYCKGCKYSVTKKNGPQACPFNYLYWDFFLRNEDQLSNNPRIGMGYRTLAKMDDDKITAIKSDAQRFFKAIENNEIV
ncbi:MAG: cryptochrome/photolyase family protein [Alphaproteobacteria bacterium]|nr:cryptochrome/photolyase family protein [Alphaproteobacteria bacterium]NCQ88760.1 cryptochrome/photolyase family protein [Alphaproteobacteria bacterium]NCT07317.1 cryptochrome/photolyase family protein [Alphaproteobacteria bacterium]